MRCADLLSVLDAIRATCEGTTTAVIKGTFSHGNGAAIIALELEGFLEAIQAEKPAAIYFWLVKFDPDDFIDLALRANDWKEGRDQWPGSRFPSPAKVRAHFQSHIGALNEPSRTHHELHACYPRDGCIRRLVVAEQWADEFYNEVEDFVEAYIQDAEADNDAAEERARLSMAEMIKTVAEDGGFKAIRGLPKRLMYLQKHYADRIPPHPRGRLVRPAQHVDLIDLHLATVLTEASKQIWAEEHL